MKSEIHFRYKTYKRAKKPERGWPDASPQELAHLAKEGKLQALYISERLAKPDGWGFLILDFDSSHEDPHIADQAARATLRKADIREEDLVFVPSGGKGTHVFSRFILPLEDLAFLRKRIIRAAQEAEIELPDPPAKWRELKEKREILRQELQAILTTRAEKKISSRKAKKQARALRRQIRKINSQLRLVRGRGRGKRRKWLVSCAFFLDTAVGFRGMPEFFFGLKETGQLGRPLKPGQKLKSAEEYYQFCRAPEFPHQTRNLLAQWCSLLPDRETPSYIRDLIKQEKARAELERHIYQLTFKEIFALVQERGEKALRRLLKSPALSPKAEEIALEKIKESCEVLRLKGDVIGLKYCLACRKKDVAYLKRDKKGQWIYRCHRKKCVLNNKQYVVDLSLEYGLLDEHDLEQILQETGETALAVLKHNLLVPRLKSKEIARLGLQKALKHFLWSKRTKVFLLQGGTGIAKTTEMLRNALEEAAKEKIVIFSSSRRELLEEALVKAREIQEKEKIGANVELALPPKKEEVCPRFLFKLIETEREGGWLDAHICKRCAYYPTCQWPKILTHLRTIKLTHPGRG